MTTFKKGDIVLYSPIMMHGAPSFGGVVREDPWQFCHGEWATHVTGLGQEYRSFTGRPDKSTAHGALVRKLESAPIYFRASDRTWHAEALDDSVLAYAKIFYVLPGTSMALVCPTCVGWGYTIVNGQERAVERAGSYEAARAAIEKAFEK